MLNSLPSAYSQLRDTIKYSRETITMEELEVAIRFKELELRTEKKIGSSESNNEALNVQGRSEKRESVKNR